MNSNTTTAVQTAQGLALAGRDTWIAALTSAALGVFIVWMVGFSHIEALHNAAHDVRHSNVFPCH